MRPLLPILALAFAAPGLAVQAEFNTSEGGSALGKLPCAQLAGQVVSDCAYEALRKPDGTATLRVRLPDSSMRYIYFDAGKPVDSDATDPISAEMQGDTMLIYLGPTERFEVPVDLVTSK